MPRYIIIPYLKYFGHLYINVYIVCVIDEIEYLKKVFFVICFNILFLHITTSIIISLQTQFGV